jgi:two-component system, NtrC family, sensor histidine kinase HydH
MKSRSTPRRAWLQTQRANFGTLLHSPRARVILKAGESEKMRFADGVILRVAAPTLVLSGVLLVTVVLAAGALYWVQLQADGAIDDALAAAEGAEHLEYVFQACRSHLSDYAMTGQTAEMQRARGLGMESGDRLIEVDSLHISTRGHILIAELRQYTLTLQSAIDQIPVSMPVDARQAAVSHVIDTVLDPQILSRAREERELCVAALHEARTRGRQTVRRAGWALVVLGIAGAGGGTLAGFGIGRRLQRELVELSIPIRTAIGSLNEVIGPVQVASTDNFAGLDAALENIAQRVGQVIERLQSAERERIRNDQMAALGQLAAGLAHELRNPLTAMKTIVDAARRDGRSVSLDDRDLAVLDEEITRLDRALQSFLDYARPPQSAKREVDLGTIAEKTSQLLAGRAEQQAISMSVERPDGPVTALADPEQLRQVLLNLMLNAFDAIGHGGKVTVRVESNGQKNTHGRGEAVLTVSDSGTGIPQAVHDRLFEPFVSTKESGTGLGLTICRRIVEDHGGRIEAADGPSGGAVFTVRLPRGGSSNAGPVDHR